MTITIDDLDSLVDLTAKALSQTSKVVYAYSMATQIDPSQFRGFLGFKSNPPGSTPASSIVVSTVSAVQAAINSVSGDLSQVSSDLQNTIQQNLSAITPWVNTASSDVQAAYQTVQNWNTAAQSDLRAAFKTLLGWAVQL